MHYSQIFKDKMIRKMTGPDAISATALSRQVDISQSTLSKWLRNAGVDSSYVYPNNNSKSIRMTDSTKPRRPQDRSPEEKLKIIIEADSLEDDQLGEFLRKKGLHETHLEQWRMQMLDALHNGRLAPKKTKPRTTDTKKIRELEKELRRKEKALAETAALLVLKKKVHQIWGDEGDDTTGKNGK